MDAERTSNSYAVAPLERFSAPPGLDGRFGANRGALTIKHIDAETDVQAIAAWLARLQSTRRETVSLYRAAAEKLLNWACFARGKAMSSLDHSDLVAYIDFLAAPRPALDWVCGAGTKRSSSEWRPFVRPLAPGSIRVHLAITSLLFDWMRAVGYAAMPEIDNRNNLRRRSDAERIETHSLPRSAPRTLTVRSWKWVQRYLAGSVEPITRLAVELEYFGNLKPVEIRQLRLADLVAPSDDCVTWRIQLASMKNKRRCMYALPPIGASLSCWLGRLPYARRTTFASADERINSPLLFDGGTRPDHRVRNVLRRSAELAAAGGDAVAAEELGAATQLCFRDAFVTHTGWDQLPGWGCVANARWMARPIGEYFKRLAPTNQMILESWAQLEPQWKPYCEALGLTPGDQVLR